MQELEPPEVPLDLESQTVPVVEEKKKEGFFKKLFSKKSQQPELKTSENNLFNQDTLGTDVPSLELPSTSDINDSNSPVITDLEGVDFKGDFPTLPPMGIQLENKSVKSKGKSKGKLKKGQPNSVNKIDESTRFDWAREIKEQEILIHDSNRFNQDANLLITKADQHVEDQTPTTNNDVFLSEHKDFQLDSESFNIPEINTELTNSLPEMIQQSPQTPMVDEEQEKIFMKISSNHDKLRKTLEKYLNNQKLFNNKARVIALFKAYDENVEKNIEDKELELSRKKYHLERFEKHLKQQEQEIKGLHNYIKNLDKKLKGRENGLNLVIANGVEQELSRRLRAEKKLLKEELKRTILLNSELKKKVKIIESDRTRFEREHTKMSETERKKLNELQSLYENKLSELDSERKVFEEKRRNSLELLKRADNITREFEDTKKMKEYVDSTKKAMDKELGEDKELKQAIDKAEDALQHEKENLDSMIFSRYIDNKLKSIKPEYLEKRQDWKTALRSNPLYGQITQCRKLLLQRNITEAKSLYNSIRKSYEQVQTNRKEKEALYTAIRELYNDIQLKIVEAQMRSK